MQQYCKLYMKKHDTKGNQEWPYIPFIHATTFELQLCTMDAKWMTYGRRLPDIVNKPHEA